MRTSSHSAESPDYPNHSSENRQQLSITTGSSLNGRTIAMLSEQSSTNTPLQSQSSDSLIEGKSHSSSTGSGSSTQTFSNSSRSSSPSSIGSRLLRAPSLSSDSSKSNLSFQTSGSYLKYLYSALNYIKDTDSVSLIKKSLD